MLNRGDKVLCVSSFNPGLIGKTGTVIRLYNGDTSPCARVDFGKPGFYNHGTMCRNLKLVSRASSSPFLDDLQAYIDAEMEALHAGF